MSWIDKRGVREGQIGSPPSLFDPYPRSTTGVGYRNWDRWRSKPDDRPMAKNHGRKRDVVWKREG